MNAEFYIKFKAKKSYGKIVLAGAPTTSVKKPTVGPEEVCVKMCIEIPDSLFEKPILVIKGQIGTDLNKESQLEITQKASELISKKLGIQCEVLEQ